MKEVNLYHKYNPQGLNIQSLLGEYSHEAGIMEAVTIDEINEDYKPSVNNELFSYQIVEIIDRIREDSGGTAYNRQVEEMVAMDYEIEKEVLAWLVYNSQAYVGLRNAIKRAVKQANELITEGWDTLDNIKQHEGKKFYITVGTTNIFGASGNRQKEKPYKLIKDAAGQYFFIAQANSRKGFRATPGMYVKQKL